MRKIAGIILVFFILAVIGYGVSWAQYDDQESSMLSSSLESGQEEMHEMDYQLETQPDDGMMDVQASDAIDSEGTGAH